MPASRRLKSSHPQKEPAERWMTGLILLIALAAIAFGAGWFADPILAHL